MSDTLPATDDLIFFSGCFCCYNALYTDFPDCVGCSGKSECLCCVEEYCCSVKGLSNPYHIGCKDSKLGLKCCTIGITKIEGLCYGKAHNCCIVGSQAFPCREEVPSVCGTCFVACKPKVAVFKPMKDLTAAGAPDGVEMTR